MSSISFEAAIPTFETRGSLPGPKACDCLMETGGSPYQGPAGQPRMLEPGRFQYNVASGVYTPGATASGDFSALHTFSGRGVPPQDYLEEEAQRRGSATPPPEPTKPTVASVGLLLGAGALLFIVGRFF